MTDPSTLRLRSGQAGSGHSRRFIKETFPVKEVSAISAKEKNIRHGHISTLHLWAWKHKRLRRPLAAISSVCYNACVETRRLYPC